MLKFCSLDGVTLEEVHIWRTHEQGSQEMASRREEEA